MYETITNHKNLNLQSAVFWNKIVGLFLLPERSADSMKAFWKKNQHKILEEYLIESIHEGIDYCLGFKEIPSPEFLKRFKAKYANEFLKLEALKNLEDGSSDEESKIELERNKYKDLGRN